MQGSSKAIVMVFVMVVMVGIVEVPAARAAVTPSECKEEQRLLVNACKAVLYGQNPSGNCCQRIRVTHWECVCPLVTPKFAAIINVQRTIKQIEGCGKTVPHKFKCGSITSP